MITPSLPATIVIAICVQLGHEQTGYADSAARMPTVHRKLFVQHCFKCHDAATQEGSVNLEELTFDIDKDIETAEKWAKVLGVINSGEMPPEDSEPLPDDGKAAFLRDLSTRMVTARKILSDHRWRNHDAAIEFVASMPTRSNRCGVCVPTFRTYPTIKPPQVLIPRARRCSFPAISWNSTWRPRDDH